MRCFAAAALLLAGASAHAEIQKSGPEVFPSKHEISAHLGYQAGFGGYFQNPSGVKVTGEYAYQFHPLAWFDLQVSNVFGFGGAQGRCSAAPAANCYWGGWAFGFAGGVKLKWTTPIPLVVEAPILLGVDILYLRECGDNGAAAPLLKTGAGAKYFITKRVGLGVNFAFSFGPGFHTGSAHAWCRRDGYTDFYGTFEFNLGAEFIL